MTGASATGRSPVQLQQLRSCVVLVELGWLEGVPLYLMKVLSPHDCGHVFIHRDHLCFQQACCVDLLCFGRPIDHSLYKCHVRSYVALYVRVYCGCPVNAPMGLIEVSNFNGRTQGHHSVNVFECSSQLIVLIFIRRLYDTLLVKKRNRCLEVWLTALHNGE